MPSLGHFIASIIRFLLVILVWGQLIDRNDINYVFLAITKYDRLQIVHILFGSRSTQFNSVTSFGALLQLEWTASGLVGLLSDGRKWTSQKLILR